jgi:hypothetical protein
MSFLKLFVVLAVLTASLAVEARSLPKKVDMFGAGADPKVCGMIPFQLMLYHLPEKLAAHAASGIVKRN